jgi:hypothetical protein
VYRPLHITVVRRPLVIVDPPSSVSFHRLHSDTNPLLNASLTVNKQRRPPFVYKLLSHLLIPNSRPQSPPSTSFKICSTRVLPLDMTLVADAGHDPTPYQISKKVRICCPDDHDSVDFESYSIKLQETTRRVWLSCQSGCSSVRRGFARSTGLATLMMSQ